MDVPAPLARSAALLRCPVCLGSLRVVERSLVCEQRHTYDVARHGHVTLARATPAAGDDAEMVAARVAVFDAGHYAPLTSALAHAAREVVARGGDAAGGGAAGGGAAGGGAAGGGAAGGGAAGGGAAGGGAAGGGAAGGGAAGGPTPPSDSPAGPVVLDLGAGTGHHLAGVLDALPGALGIALDTSRPALRHAARADADIAAVVADVWQALPVADAAIDLVLDVFSPRNGAEMARVLKPGGVALVVIPTAEHLAELADLHGVQVDPAKVERLERTVGAHLELESRAPVRWTMDLTAEEVAAVLKMSPAGAHRRGGEPPRGATVTGSVELWRFRRSDMPASP